jgi:hypothetical protein
VKKDLIRNIKTLQGQVFEVAAAPKRKLRHGAKIGNASPKIEALPPRGVVKPQKPPEHDTTHKNAPHGDTTRSIDIETVHNSPMMTGQAVRLVAQI